MRLVKYRNAYAAEWRENGKRYRRSLGTDDKVTAQVVFERFKSLRSETPEKPVTVEQCWTQYRETLAGRPAHVTMGHEWKAIGPAFGDKVVAFITEEDCRLYAAQRRAKGRKDGTIWTELGRLRMALVWASKKNIISKPPHIWRPKPGPARDKSLTRDQARAVVDACALPHVRLFVILALTTAGRSAALLGLTWDRVNFASGLIQLSDPTRGTTKKGRATVPINEWAEPYLRQAQEEAVSKYVIEWGGRRVLSIKKGIKAAGERAGVPWVTPHVFRHSAARFMAEDGVPMPEIAAYLGHSDSRMTERVYAKFAPTYLRKAGASLNLGGGRHRD